MLNRCLTCEDPKYSIFTEAKWFQREEHREKKNTLKHDVVLTVPFQKQQPPSSCNESNVVVRFDVVWSIFVVSNFHIYIYCDVSRVFKRASQINFLNYLFSNFVVFESSKRKNAISHVFATKSKRKSVICTAEIRKNGEFSENLSKFSCIIRQIWR